MKKITITILILFVCFGCSSKSDMIDDNFLYCATKFNEAHDRFMEQIEYGNSDSAMYYHGICETYHEMCIYYRNQKQ